MKRIIEIMVAIVIFFIVFLIIRALLAPVFPYLPPPIESTAPAPGR